MTFVQQRFDAGDFDAVAAGWTFPDDGLAVTIPVHRFPDGTGSSALKQAARLITFPVRSFNRNIDLIRTIRAIKPDIVHAHFGTNAIRVVGACRFLGIPLVCSFYGYDVAEVSKSRLNRLRYKRMFKTVGCITAEGPALARTLSQLGVRQEKLALLPLALSGEAMKEPVRKERNTGAALALIQVCRFVEKKGVDTALRAVAWAKDHGADVQFLLVGDGPLAPALRLLVRELGLDEQVHMPGFVPHAELQSLWVGSDVLLQPSRTASDGDTEGGHPTVVIEAQANGLAVLGSTHADIPSVVEHGVTGLLSAENDHVQLGRHILELAADRQRIKAMGESARASVLKRHSPRAVLAIKEDIYRDVLARAATLRPCTQLLRRPGRRSK